MPARLPDSRACARGGCATRREPLDQHLASDVGQTADVDFRVLGSVGNRRRRPRSCPSGAGCRGVSSRILLAYRNSVVSTDRLVEVLWDEPPDSAAATLQSYVSRLRRFVELDGGATLVQPGARLRARGPRRPASTPAASSAGSPTASDLLDTRSRRRPRPARRRARRVAGRRLRRVRRDRVDPARGDPARGAAAGRDRGAHRRRAARRPSPRGGGRARGAARRPPAARAVRPRSRCSPCTASGRQAEALRVAQQFRGTLRDDLGLEPSAELRDLESRDPRGARRTSRGCRRRCRRRRPSAAATGRDVAADRDDRARRSRARPRARGPAVRDRPHPHACSAPAASARPASRTASPATHRRRSSPTASAWSSSHRCATRARCPPRSRAALDVQQRPNRIARPTRSSRCWRRSRVLLVLDNCEHVLDTTSELVELILQWCPDVQVLATSREPLGIPAEVVWSVPPLPVPATRGSPARRACSRCPRCSCSSSAPAPRSPTSRSTTTTASAVAEICIRLDGVPLALELAAARMRSMSPTQLAERLPERFRVLAGSRRATDPRHRTLRDLVAVVVRAADAGRAAAVRPAVGVRRVRSCSSGRAGRARATASTSATSPACSACWSTSRCCAAQGGRVTGCSRRCASSGASSSPTRPDADAIRDAHVAVHAELSRDAARAVSAVRDEGQWMDELDRQLRRHARRAPRRRRRRRRRLRAAHRDRRARVRVAAHPLRAPRVGRRDRRHAGRERAPALSRSLLGVVAYGHFVRGELDDRDRGGRAGRGGGRAPRRRSPPDWPSGRWATPSSSGCSRPRRSG